MLNLYKLFLLSRRSTSKKTYFTRLYCLLRQVNADEQRVILTFDRAYGKLIYPLRLRSPRGVIYLRFRPHTPEEPASILLNLLQTEGLQFEERFTVVERDRIRQRPLP
jgi:hypothetical protein